MLLAVAVAVASCGNSILDRLKCPVLGTRWETKDLGQSAASTVGKRTFRIKREK